MHPISQRIEAEYRRRTSQSAAYATRARQVLPGGDTRTSTYYAPYPLVMDHGEGTTLQDVDGHSYLDCMNNATSLIHGHAFPPVVEAMARQAVRGTAWGAPCMEQIELAEWLCERVDSLAQVRFTNSGTEATLMAIRVARTYTGKELIVKIEGGYHGTHDLVCASVDPEVATAGPTSAPRTVPQGQGLSNAVLDQVRIVPYNERTALADILDTHAGQVAAVVVEPLLGSHGFVTAAPEYLQTVRAMTADRDVLLILDEVQTFRLDSGGAQKLYGISPDLTAMAKIIGGGLPVGAIGGRAEIMALFDPAGVKAVAHGGTFNGNPMVMAAGLAAMRHLTASAVARLNRLGDRLRAGIEEVAVEQGLRLQTTGLGSLVGYHFSPHPVRNYRDTRLAPAELRHSFFLACLNHGLMLSPASSLNTSTVMSEADIDKALHLFQAALVDVKPLIAAAYPHLLL